MTLKDRYAALMVDLVEERKGAVAGSWWASRLDEKIADLKAATEEKFNGDSQLHTGLKPLWAPGSPREDVAGEVRHTEDSHSPGLDESGTEGNGSSEGPRDLGVERGDNQ